MGGKEAFRDSAAVFEAFFSSGGFAGLGEVVEQPANRRSDDLQVSPGDFGLDAGEVAAITNSASQLGDRLAPLATKILSPEAQDTATAQNEVEGSHPQEKAARGVVASAPSPEVISMRKEL